MFEGEQSTRSDADLQRTADIAQAYLAAHAAR
jgi:hypothetical protein